MSGLFRYRRPADCGVDRIDHFPGAFFAAFPIGVALHVRRLGDFVGVGDPGEIEKFAVTRLPIESFRVPPLALRDGRIHEDLKTSRNAPLKDRTSSRASR